MRVIILGGTGILSSSITKKCLEEGHEVIHFNRNISENEFNVKTIIGNRNNEDDLKGILDFNPEIIIDMLCFNKSDAIKTINIFKNKINQYIYCSTSCVYTPKSNKEIITEDSEKSPLFQYGQDKLAAEEEFLRASEKKYFNTTIFRPGHVFNDRFVVNNLTMNGLYIIGRMKRNLDVVLTQGGNKYWQACHADNIGIAFSKSCGNSICYNKIYNISGCEKMTWNEVYETMLLKINSKSKIKYLDAEEVIRTGKEEVDFLQTVTQYDWNHDVSLLKKDIGEYYKVSFEEGITSTINKNIDKITDNLDEDNLYERLLLNKKI